ncbi:MAG TPA: VWA domain-containing protein [Bacteroidales bacterium]|nr:VWA domain-containing protein [Bacteroidales bacterium]HPS16353.1 VWA domain-containing protein [Bacteroidales bacterium]
MQFANPYYLYLLLVIPVFVLLYFLLNRWKRKTYEKFGDTSVITQLMPEVSEIKPVIKLTLRMIAVALLVIAIARPQTGAKLAKAKHKGVELMILLDVSNSMLAQDIKPNRLDRAKLAIQKLMDQLDNDKIGIIVFAGKPYVQLPITFDYAAGKLFLSTISTDMIPTQGTAIGAAIDMAMNSFSFTDKTKNKAIIIISDGENHEDDAVASAKAAVDKGVYVHTIGIGSTEGSPIPIKGKSGNSFKQDNEGKTVVTKLNETMLQEISTAGKGIYVHASNADVGLTKIMDEIDKMEKKEFDEKIYSDYEDQYQYFIAFALFFMLWELFIFERKSKWYYKLNIFGENKKVN